MVDEFLKLDNQICFPVYAVSRLITREYQPFLNELGVTYPQYLVLLILWEQDQLTVNAIKEKLILNTNTVTPLLKRMESLRLIKRQRSEDDERKVIIALTEHGKNLKAKALTIPERLTAGLSSSELQVDDLIDLKNRLHQLLDYLVSKNNSAEESR
ncbi:MarR family winged helix-turn-helix transcriptional regulator [Larkinella sp. VNQ87]|uniref:MarR family winged helix-turn-helix transcriptional regulator n=1 Tax=Larkinella sp. VNQ87 TaxID=3400921 RepID=UPI003C0D60A3